MKPPGGNCGLRIKKPILSFNPQSAIRNPQFLKPFGELEGEQLAEQFADADAGEEVAVPARIVFFRLVISIIWTIQG
jgi:hypothetical protein